MQALESGNQSGVIERIGITASSKTRAQVRDGLVYLVGPTRVKPGCVDCRVQQDLNNANAFFFESRWRSMDDFLEHVCSELYRTLLEVIETAVDEPVIEYHIVSRTLGLDLVREARQGTARPQM
jgi:quinol monooxygenase YgiN